MQTGRPWPNGPRSRFRWKEGTVTWYALRISDTSYGIFDTFATGDARTAHLNGQIPAALASVSADLLATQPEIRLVDVLAVK
jgi:hypothetical protein